MWIKIVIVNSTQSYEHNNNDNKESIKPTGRYATFTKILPTKIQKKTASRLNDF